MRDIGKRAEERVYKLHRGLYSSLKVLLQLNAPVDTGDLRRSIRVVQRRRVVRMLFYGWIQNRTHNRGWIDRSVRQAVGRTEF